MVNTDMKFRKNSDPGYLGKCSNSILTILCQSQRISFETRNRDLTQRPIREAMCREERAPYEKTREQDSWSPPLPAATAYSLATEAFLAKGSCNLWFSVLSPIKWE